MKASAVDYIRATSLPHALALLAQHGDAAKLIAGGQSLLPALNLRLSAPALLIDIGRLPELQGVTVADGTLRIGAGCTHATLLTHPALAEHAPLIPRALAHVAHPAIRTRGTIGGSLANADPAAELPACALALGAAMVLQGLGRHADRRRRTPSSRGCSKRQSPSGEILVAVEIPLGGCRLVGLCRAGTALQATMPWSGWRRTARPGALAARSIFSVGTTAILARRAAAALGRLG